MSFKMTYHTIQRDPEFAMAMQKLMSTPVTGVLAKQLKKLNKAFSFVKSKIAADYDREILKVFAQHKDGKIVTKETNAQEFVIAEGKTPADVEAAQADFWKKETTVDGPMIPMSLLSEIKFSALELCALDPLCVDLDLAVGPEIEIPVIPATPEASPV